MIIFLAELIPFHIQAHCINHSTSSLPQQSAGKLLPFLPSHMFHTSPATASKFADQYDQVKHMASLILKVLPRHRDYFCESYDLLWLSCDLLWLSCDILWLSCDLLIVMWSLVIVMWPLVIVTRPLVIVVWPYLVITCASMVIATLKTQQTNLSEKSSRKWKKR